MKYPLMKNNLLEQDLLPVIELLKTKDPILTSVPGKEWSLVNWLGVKHSVFVNRFSATLCLVYKKNFLRG